MTASDESIAFAKTLAQAASDVKATGGTCIDVSEQLVLVEVFLILSASSERQVRAVFKAVDEAAHKAGQRLQHREGTSDEMRWVLLDYGDVVVHIFHEDERDFYALDKLWGDCPVIELECDFSSEGEQPNPLVAFGM